MSHLDVFQTKAGEPFITNITALEIAASAIGMTLTKKNEYRWFGRSVGDYPVPAGTTVSELGKNAAYVLSVDEETCAKLQIDSNGLYDLAVIEDPNNPGAYTLMYDFWGQQNRLDRVIGSPIRENGTVVSIAPLLVRQYRMTCVELQARMLGDKVFWETAKNGDPIARVVPAKRQNSLAYA